MTRSRLFDLPRWPSKGTRRKLEATWLEELETHGMPDGLLQPPSQPPPQLFEAVEQFNNGLYWECHETLEEVWLETLYPLRFFYHAIIKVSVGFHHMNRHNRHGARVKLGDAVGIRFRVVDGLEPGDWVVIRGNERLRTGQKVRSKDP